ncbi:cytochrome c oxidase assembly protein [Blastomyces gilchristii SLH14081]|uniref:Cytochrome c oxidase assembly protein n=1 Tax=Blastomyces gilchristii (strain SLH14081) TaxID=559298 RepID=A0A179UL97_BLAGS|nr:cytochrome c oxidase assembly protein [Blastomyces gilchristii SLH14081]OAT08008.1 cytochrome c oxidase assembly protein [Blastomyces gilchristii SLH14081]
MSRASKLTLAGTSLMTVGIVYFVHWTQEADKAAMHAGVQRDLENQRIKRERQADFEMQRALEAEYRKLQTVSDGGNGENIDSGAGIWQESSKNQLSRTYEAMSRDQNGCGWANQRRISGFLA